MTRSLVLMTVSLLVSIGCEDVKYTDYFEGEVDSDVGQGAADDLDAGGADQQSGDPCGDDNPWGCDPLTNAGCADGGVACDWGQHGGVDGFFCFTDATEPVGAECVADGGPWCGGGATCADGICVRYCCADGDCATGPCEPVAWEPVEGPLGLCSAD